MEQSIGHKIRDARIACGLTQAQLGERLNVKQPRVAAVERGRLKDEPSLHWVLRAAEALGVDPATLDDSLASWSDATLTFDKRRSRWLMRVGRRVVQADDRNLGPLLRSAKNVILKVK